MLRISQSANKADLVGRYEILFSPHRIAVNKERMVCNNTALSNVADYELVAIFESATNF